MSIDLTIGLVISVLICGYHIGQLRKRVQKLEESQNDKNPNTSTPNTPE